MLGTAGEEAVYLWDLNEEGRREVVEIPQSDDGDDIGVQVSLADR